ncbi:MAG: hypothetical protein NC350_03185 [Corallococcus sp.]|nr:hypothetical protein [Corallococcus sp.]
MTIKQVVLKSERQKVADFLKGFGLEYEQNIDISIYTEENGKIVGTVSAAGYVIKCLAVDKSLQGENMAVTLVSEIIKRLHEKGEYYYQVFTKPDYREVFVSLGFLPILQTEKFVALEGGDGSLAKTLDKIKMQIHFNLGIDVADNANDIACVVLNGNPFTVGHLHLCEQALVRHNYLLVFVLEEEGSYFNFKERYAMAYLALKPYKNALVLPSTKYVVSRATFPGYFLKSVDETTEQYAKYDATLFRDYFMPQLDINKRYVGSEKTDYMKLYNRVLSEVLGDKVEEMPRLAEQGKDVSAKHVRALIKDGNIAEAAKYVPNTNKAVFMGLVTAKNAES